MDRHDPAVEVHDPAVEVHDPAVEVDEAWQRIKNARGDVKVKADEIAHWLPIWKASEDEFAKLAKGDDGKTNVSLFAEKFGKDGAEDDFRWMLASVHLTIPKNAGYSPHEKTLDGSPVEDEASADSTLAFCEAQVKQLLSNPKARERYFHFVVWTRMYFGAGELDAKTGVRFGYVRKRLAKDARPSDYWYLARDVVLLAHAMGRSDLLKDVDCGDLAKQFDKLDKWVAENERYLVANKKTHTWAVDLDAKKKGVPLRPKNDWPVLEIPTKPFPDWKGEAPPAEMLGKLLQAAQ